MAARLSAAGFALRFIGAAVLVFATFNPSGYSFIHWALQGQERLPLKVLCAVLLTIGWVIFVRASLRSLGVLGMVLVAILFASVIWVLVDFGWLAVDKVDVLSYVILVMLSFLLAVGMSWSHIRRRLSGQLDVDEVDD